MWTIFTRDIRKIRTNVIALIVVLGVTVVPCLYAWFNIAASWDPYGNTGNLKVAVASVDEGYTGNLIPLQLNLGDQVLSALRENTQLNWVFTTKSKAMKGVKSGEYYAAIVIPEDFSTNLMSVFSSDIKKPEITYYSNAKENAIAPKVTDKGATAVQTQVNEVFIETISDTVLTALQTVANTQTVRAVFIIDPEGMIRTILYYPMSTGRNIPEIIRILQSLQLNDKTHYSTPANWQPGDAVVMGAPLTIEEAQERLESSDNTIEHLDWYLTMKKMK